MKVANGLNSLAILPVQKRCARNLLHSPTREGGEPGDNRVTLPARVVGDTPAQLFARDELHIDFLHSLWLGTWDGLGEEIQGGLKRVGKGLFLIQSKGTGRLEYLWAYRIVFWCWPYWCKYLIFQKHN